MSEFSFREIRSHVRPVNSVYARFILEPLAVLMVLPIARRTRLTPLHLTGISLLLSMISAVFFMNGLFIAGAVVFQLSVVLDFADGLLARVKGNGSIAGILTDTLSDISRVLINFLALLPWIAHSFLSLSLMLIFLTLHFGEFLINRQIQSIKFYLESDDHLKLSALEKVFLKLKTTLEKYGLKVLVLHYQERLWFSLFLGPVVGNLQLGFLLAVFITILFLPVKIKLDFIQIKMNIMKERATG